MQLYNISFDPFLLIVHLYVCDVIRVSIAIKPKNINYLLIKKIMQIKFNGLLRLLYNFYLNY